MDWSEYYAALSGREPRPLLRRALEARGDLAPGSAIDLGSGDGIETLALLVAGWKVTAIDVTPAAAELVGGRVSDEHRPNLTVQTASFEDAELGEADLIYAGYSLPFTDPAAFPKVWARIRAALQPGGVLAVDLFGPNDTWAADPAMTITDRMALDALIDGLELVAIEETDADGMAMSGPKHWHVFEFVARRPMG